MFFSQSLGLFVDLYELLMAQIYVEREYLGNATFSLFIRKRPKKRPFFIACGLDPFLNALEKFRFSEEDLEYLESLKIFKPKFLDYLKNFRFKGEIRALPEGTIFFENEPICEVTAELPVAQLLETLILNTFHIEILSVSKAVLSILHAGDIPCIDFSARRTHGIDASLHVARASYIAGFKATSNVLAGKLFGIPVTGTMAHSFVEIFSDEETAFKTYAETYPNNTILLIDTYNTLEGARKVVKLKDYFKEKGIKLKGVRIDSGDLEKLSIEVRKILNKGNLKNIGIFLSSGIDEKIILRLKEKEIPVDGFGIGTKLGVSVDQPYLDIAYKLVEYEGKPKAKLSPGKKFYPGAKDLYRIYKNAQPEYDWLCLKGEKPPVEKENAKSLLILVYKGTQKLYTEDLNKIRNRLKHQLNEILPKLNYSPKAYKKFKIKISSKLKQLLKQIV